LFSSKCHKADVEQIKTCHLNEQQQLSLLFPSKLRYARDETTWAKKQGQNKSEKEGGKQRTIKNQVEKRRKGNNTLNQKSEEGWEKTWQKGNKNGKAEQKKKKKAYTWSTKYVTLN
jgi:hypothetical protein